VVLAVNGVRHVAAGVHPSMTLLEFLRTKTPVRGPKLGCGEGTSALGTCDHPTPSMIFVSPQFQFVPVRIFY
jgi:xanthine dehydrogenase iron-sulfur cluster and FAD-binding subunit A